VAGGSADAEGGPGNGSALCLQCGLCCDGTLFGETVVRIPERGYVEFLGLEVRDGAGHGLVAPQPCSAFVDGCCALYEVGRPANCDEYRCAVLTGYTDGRAGLDDSLAVIRRVRSLAREIEFEMGLPVGEYSMTALTGYLAEHEPWSEPERHRRFLVAFHRFHELGRAHFGCDAKPMEEKAAAAGERLAADGS